MNKLKTEYLFFRQQEHNMKVLLIMPISSWLSDSKIKN